MLFRPESQITAVGVWDQGSRWRTVDVERSLRVGLIIGGFPLVIEGIILGDGGRIAKTLLLRRASIARWETSTDHRDLPEDSMARILRS